MYILIDILVIAFVLGFIIYGATCGFFESTINVVLVLACVGGSAILSIFTVESFLIKWGWLNETMGFVMGILGNSKIPQVQAVVELVAMYVSYGLLVVLCFIIYDIVLNLVRKLILKISRSFRKCKLIGVLDNILGALVNAAVTIGLVLVLLAFFHAFLEGQVLFTTVNEAILATDVVSFIYKINPLNAMFESMGIAESLETLFASFIGA